ncbi:MAG: hypothetical protein ACREAC_03375, partial [Blastocatellia bacterium]
MKMSVVAIFALIVLASCHNDKNPSPNGNKQGSTPDALASPSPPPPPKPAEAVNPSFKSCNEYMPLIPGSTAKYSILYSSGLQADASVVVDALPGGQFQETSQIVDQTGGSHKLSLTKTIYGCDGGKVKLFSQTEDNKVDANSNHMEVKYKDPAIAMIEPSVLRQGTSWSYDLTQVFQLPGQAPVSTNQYITTSFTVEGPEDISVPAGTFKTIKVVRKVGTASINEY